MIQGDAKIVVPGDDVVACEMDQDAVLLNLRDGEYHQLNTVAASIWNYARQPRTVDEIHAFLVEKYEVDADVCRQDLCEVLEDFLEKGLVKVAEDTGP